jgi:hypothetical protein
VNGRSAAALIRNAAAAATVSFCRQHAEAIDWSLMALPPWAISGELPASLNVLALRLILAAW